jgi:hypothetical protein
MKMYNRNTDESYHFKFFFFFGLLFLDSDNVIVSRMIGLYNLPAMFSKTINPRTPCFPNIWAQFSTSCNRTTNGCESFHSHLMSSFYFNYPNIYNFIDVLVKIQLETYIKYRKNGIKTMYVKTKHL